MGHHVVTRYPIDQLRAAKLLEQLCIESTEIKGLRLSCGRHQTANIDYEHRLRVLPTEETSSITNTEGKSLDSGEAQIDMRGICGHHKTPSLCPPNDHKVLNTRHYCLERSLKGRASDSSSVAHVRLKFGGKLFL
jgi:hypothetical protein